MKKLLTIGLLGLLLFCWGGYRLVLGYAETQSDLRLEAALDLNNYNDADLLSIKFPTNMPYIANSPEYYRVNGEVKVNGVIYKYVKRRVYNDSLELLCIPNIEKTSLREEATNLFMKNNDLATSSSKKSTDHHTQAKFSLSDFTGDHFFAWQFRNGEPKKVYYEQNNAASLADYKNRLERPPQA